MWLELPIRLRTNQNDCIITAVKRAPDRYSVTLADALDKTVNRFKSPFVLPYVLEISDQGIFRSIGIQTTLVKSLNLQERMITLKKSKKLNQLGIARIIMLITVALIGAMGTYMLSKVSHGVTPAQTGYPVTDGASKSGSLPSGPSYSKNVGWIIDAYTFKQFESVGASSMLINTIFNNNRSFVFGSSASSIGIPTADYTSYQSIVAAFANGALPAGYKAVMYDNENWPLTPLVEQQHPDKYEHMVANLLHQHGLLYIATPAADIVRATGVVIDNNTQETYLKRDIAGGAARYADVINIQAQYLQPNLGKFTAFAVAAAKEARAANPHVKVYIGIATGPDGQAVTAKQLYAAYLSVRSVADGYWLNVSGKGAYCPNCSAPKPKLAVDLLHDVYGSK